MSAGLTLNNDERNSSDDSDDNVVDVDDTQQKDAKVPYDVDSGDASRVVHVLEIYDDNNMLIKNITSNSHKAHFQVADLPPGFAFNLILYSSNQNGHSEKIQIIASTLVGEPRKLGKFKDVWFAPVNCSFLFQNT